MKTYGVTPACETLHMLHILSTCEPEWHEDNSEAHLLYLRGILRGVRTVYTNALSLHYPAHHSSSGQLEMKRKIYKQLIMKSKLY